MIMKRNEVLELSIGFAVEVIRYCELLEEKKKYVIARQLLKSGTSIGYWIYIIQQVDTYPKPPESISSTLKSIINLLNKIIITLKTK